MMIMMMMIIIDNFVRRSLLQYKSPSTAERALWWQHVDSFEGGSQPCVADKSKTAALRRTVLHQTQQRR